MNFWPSSFAKKAIIYGLLVPILISLIYPQYFIPPELYIIGSITIIGFFVLLNNLSQKWVKYSIRKFEKKIFWTSLIIRFLFVLYLYLLTFLSQPGNFPFELNAADSWVYHNAAIALTDIGPLNYFSELPDIMKSRSDYGFPSFLAFVYKIFGPLTLPARLINIILSSFTVILLSRISSYLFTEKHGKLTGIIAMLFPSLIWFSAIQLKETLMIFIVVSIFYYVLKIYFNKKVSLIQIILILFYSLSLFYFRTFLAVIVIVSVLLFLFLNSRSSKAIFINTIAVGLVAVGFFVVNNSLKLNKDIDIQYAGREGFMENNLSTANQALDNVNYKNATVIPFIFTGAFLTPFPSLLNTEDRQYQIIAHYQNEMVKNIMYYFGFIGLIILFRKYFRKSIIVSFFIVTYLLVLMLTSNSFIDRFQLPNVAFIIIAMSVGIIESSAKWKRNFNYYFILLFMIHLSWTVFKLNIRGL